MANYSYDESGNMAAYFVITFLSIFLIPYTLSPLFATSSAFPYHSPGGHLIASFRATISPQLPMPAMYRTARTYPQAGARLSLLSKARTTVRSITTIATSTT